VNNPNNLNYEGGPPIRWDFSETPWKVRGELFTAGEVGQRFISNVVGVVGPPPQSPPVVPGGVRPPRSQQPPPVPDFGPTGIEEDAPTVRIARHKYNRDITAPDYGADIIVTTEVEGAGTAVGRDGDGVLGIQTGAEIRFFNERRRGEEPKKPPQNPDDGDPGRIMRPL
jgi:hypothetical protein